MEAAQALIHFRSAILTTAVVEVIGQLALSCSRSTKPRSFPPEECIVVRKGMRNSPAGFYKEIEVGPSYKAASRHLGCTASLRLGKAKQKSDKQLVGPPPASFEYKQQTLQLTKELINKRFPQLCDLVEEGGSSLRNSGSC